MNDTECFTRNLFLQLHGNIYCSRYFIVKMQYENIIQLLSLAIVLRVHPILNGKSLNPPQQILFPKKLFQRNASSLTISLVTNFTKGKMESTQCKNVFLSVWRLRCQRDYLKPFSPSLSFSRTAKLLVGLAPSFIRKDLMMTLFLENISKIQHVFSTKTENTPTNRREI